MKYLLKMLSLLVVFGACNDGGPLEPSSPPLSLVRAGSPALSVMTWNIYVGAQLKKLLTVEDPSEIPFKVAEIYGDVLATDFPSRAIATCDALL